MSESLKTIVMRERPDLWKAFVKTVAQERQTVSVRPLTEEDKQRVDEVTLSEMIKGKVTIQKGRKVSR